MTTSSRNACLPAIMDETNALTVIHQKQVSLDELSLGFSSILLDNIFPNSLCKSFYLLIFLGGREEGAKAEAFR